MRIPKINVASAEVKRTEVQGVVTVGPESAEKLTKLLGRKVEVGEEFDLGVLAVYDRDWSRWKRFKENLKIAIVQSKSPFHKPL